MSKVKTTPWTDSENQTLYAKFGYVEYARREEKGFSRIYVKKVLV